MRRRGISALVASHRALRACANAGMLSREPYCRRRSAPTMAAQPRELGGGAAGAMPADRGGLRQRRVNQVAPPRVPSPAAYPPAAAAVDAGVGARPRWRRRLCEWVVLLAAFAAVDAGLRHAMSDPSSFPEHFKALVRAVPRRPLPPSLRSRDATDTSPQRPEYNGTIDVVDVAELERGGAAGFYRNVVALAKPVLIRGAAARWPAFDKWSNAYLRERHGEKRVPVDVAADRVFHRAAAARGYMIRPDVQMMPLATYVDALEVGGWVDAAAFAPPGGSSSARASESGAARLHLALEEVEMADHVPDMLDDIAVPEWAGFLTVQHRNLWMAAEDKVSKLHFDNYENLLALVAGRKRLTLFSPFDTPFLYPSEWPEFRQKFGSDGTVEVRARRRSPPMLYLHSVSRLTPAPPLRAAMPRS